MLIGLFDDDADTPIQIIHRWPLTHRVNFRCECHPTHQYEKLFIMCNCVLHCSFSHQPNKMGTSDTTQNIRNRRRKKTSTTLAISSTFIWRIGSLELFIWASKYELSALCCCWCVVDLFVHLFSSTFQLCANTTICLPPRVAFAALLLLLMLL